MQPLYLYVIDISINGCVRLLHIMLFTFLTSALVQVECSQYLLDGTRRGPRACLRHSIVWKVVLYGADTQTLQKHGAYKGKVRVKFILEQAMKTQRGSRGIAVLFPCFWRLMRVGDQQHTPATLPLGEIWYPFYSRLGGPQGWSGWVPTGIRSPYRPARSESLYRLSYPGPCTMLIVILNL